MIKYPYLYNSFGLVIGSELECPELLPIRADMGDAVDLAITLGALPPMLENVHHVTPHIQVGDRAFQLFIEGVARFRGINGTTIIVDALPEAEPEDVRLFLFGSVLGALFHQRGQLPLHASAVAIDGKAVAFCGNSGAGKSTLSAALQRMGYPLICDDIAVIGLDDSGVPLVYPGIPRVKLWKDALEHFEVDHSTLTRAYSRADKFHLESWDAFHHQPLPLATICLLEKLPADSSVAIERIAAADSMGILLDHTYRNYFLRQLGNPHAHFQQCVQIARAIPLFRYRRPWNLAGLQFSVEDLLAHLRR